MFKMLNIIKSELKEWNSDDWLCASMIVFTLVMGAWGFIHMALYW